jgi:predicted nucleic acid-binding Zn ribbon protein
MSAPPATTPTAPAPRDLGPMHACVRCGAPIPLDLSMCERCNPLGLEQPATSQAHGTIALGLFIGVVVLAIVAKLAVSGVGPFTGRVAGVEAVPGGLTVTLSVQNTGTKEGTTRCRVFDPASPGLTDHPAIVYSPRIGAGETATFDSLVTTLGTEARSLQAECR